MKSTIRVYVVDDHPVVRKGIRMLLTTEPDIEVVGEAQNGEEAVVDVARLKPDIILMDLVMPNMDGITAIRHIVAEREDAAILVLTSFAADDQVFPALQAGARGYLLKDTGPTELVNSIRQVYWGESSLHPVIARKLLQELSHLPQAPLATDPLTTREIEVLGLVGQGESNQAIAAALSISESTVRTHVSSILSKLHLASRTQAALYAVREGFTAD